MVSVPKMPSGAFPGVSRGEPGLKRSSLMTFGLPRPKEPFLSVTLFECSGVLGLSVSIGGASASGSLSDSMIAARLCFDGDLVNRPSGPLGPFPLLLYSWLKSAMCLFMFFLCTIYPFGVATVCLVPDIANCGLSENALSNLDRWCFFLKKRKDSY